MLKFNKKKLQNNLSVYHIPLNRGSNVISVDIFYKVGSRNETMGKSGISHMLEHLNFKSTKNLKAGEFDEIVKGFGGVSNASTGFDYTHYFIKCSNDNLKKSLELFAELMKNLKLSNKEFLPERDVVLEERLWRTDNDPFGYLFFRLYNEAFTYHPYHWTPIGFIGDIKNWKIQDIKEFHSKFYQPQNAVLIISGDIDKNSAFDLAKKCFGNIKNTSKIPQMHYQEPKQDGEKRVVLQRDSEVEMLAIAFKIPPFNHEDQPTLNAISEYLSSGKSSILHKVLVDEKELVNQISTYNMDSIDENLFIFLCVCNDGVKAESVESEILTILSELKQNEIDSDDLMKVKNLIKTEFIYSFDSASKVANLYGSYLARGDIKPLFKLNNEIEALSKEKIKEAAQKYFTNKNSTTIILRKADYEAK